jgi:xylulokinase
MDVMRLADQRPEVILGIDVGTQSTKCVVLDANGTLRGVGQEGYGVLSPRSQWFEQDPAAWWDATINAVRTALREAGVSAGHVQGIGVTGQMHGLVLLDRRMEPLRPAMIWMDRRSANLCAIVTARVPHDTVVNVAANRLSPGFAGASLAWLREAEPHLLDEAHAALQPKDYLILRLTGVFSSEPSDASATWLYDVPGRTWSETLIQACGVTPELLPTLSDSAAVVGKLTADAAYALGLKAEIPVVAGAGDQAALLLGAGVVEPGRGAITLGTGGQITVVSSRPMIDPELRLNTFCHALPDRWYTMGAILNGGIALRWWRNVLGDTTRAYSDLLAAAGTTPAGADGLIFVPYLEGERTPHVDPHATGAFVGLTTQHTQAHMTRAVLEGVAYAFRDCLDTLRVAGPVPDHFLIGGGGSQGALWRAILASVLNVSLQTIEGREHTAVGAAMLAGLGTRVFSGVAEAVGRVVRYGVTEIPPADDRDHYAEQFARFRALYPALRDAR